MEKFYWELTFDTMLRFRELVREYKWHDVHSDQAGAIREEIFSLPGFPAEARKMLEVGLEPVIILRPVAEERAFSDLGGDLDG